MDDDLNVPKALAAFFTFERKLNSVLDAGKVSKGDAQLMLETLEKVDSVLGVMQDASSSEAGRGGERHDPEAPLIADLVAQREDARKRKDYKRSDEIRDELKKKGVVVEDTPTGPVWHRLSTASEQMLK